MASMTREDVIHLRGMYEVLGSIKISVSDHNEGLLPVLKGESLCVRASSMPSFVFHFTLSFLAF